MGHCADEDVTTRVEGTLFDTAPPDEPAPGARGWKARLVDRVSDAILPIVQYAARPYVGGDTIDDAMSVAGRLTDEGFTTTLGYWDRGRDTGRQVADICLSALGAMATRPGDRYLSIKPPALRFSLHLAEEIAAAAATHHIRIHCDSHGPEVVDLSNTMLQAMMSRLDLLGTTLPGRWARSLRDADWAVEHALNVRVVKGQWPDPNDPHRDMSAGFLEVIDRLAGRARRVSVATQDFALAREALARLRLADTPCELEILFGMPAKALLRWAKDKRVPVRVYVPYGAGFVPSALRVLKRNPRLLLAVARAQIEAGAALLSRRASTS